jgi:hypothetical protein
MMTKISSRISLRPRMIKNERMPRSAVSNANRRNRPRIPTHYLGGDQKQSLQRVEFDEAILFFSDEENDAENHSQTTKKVRDVTEHRPDIGIQSETGLATGGS